MDLLIPVFVAAAAAVGFFFYRERELRKEQLMEKFGDDLHPKTLAALAKEGEDGELAQDGLWLQDNFRELSERFRGQCVAVVRRKVVAVARTEDEAWSVAKSAWPELTPFVRRLAERP
jgi:hypothetical protein